MFWSPKNVPSEKPTKKEIFLNTIYQQNATQLQFLQRINPNFERNIEKKYKKKVEVQTLTLIDRSRAKSSRNAASDADDVKTDSFFSGDSETEIVIKKEVFGI